MWPHSNCLEPLRLKAWVFAVCLCFFVLWRQRPSGGWIPHPESPSTWLRIHTRRTIPGAQQTVSVQKKIFFSSHITEPVCPTHFHKMGLYYETMSNIYSNVTEQNSNSKICL